jgi:hypothetical protein
LVKEERQERKKILLIYKNNVGTTLKQAIKAKFPQTVLYIGEKLFNALCRFYLYKYSLSDGTYTQLYSGSELILNQMWHELTCFKTYFKRKMVGSLCKSFLFLSKFH